MVCGTTTDPLADDFDASSRASVKLSILGGTVLAGRRYCCLDCINRGIGSKDHKESWQCYSCGLDLRAQRMHNGMIRTPAVHPTAEPSEMNDTQNKSKRKPTRRGRRNPAAEEDRDEKRLKLAFERAEEEVRSTSSGGNAHPQHS